MDPRTVITEKYGLRVVTRELFGRDRATETFVAASILNAVYPRLGLKSASETPNAVYNVVMEAARIIVQTVSLEEVEDSEAHWPDSLVLPNTADYPACVAFYDSLMDLPARYMDFLSEGVKAINADVPNLNGGKAAKKSPSAPASALKLTVAS
jgi:hypothetical protein